MNSINRKYHVVPLWKSGEVRTHLSYDNCNHGMPTFCYETLLSMCITISSTRSRWHSRFLNWNSIFCQAMGSQRHYMVPIVAWHEYLRKNLVRYLRPKTFLHRKYELLLSIISMIDVKSVHWGHGICAILDKCHLKIVRSYRSSFSYSYNLNINRLQHLIQWQWQTHIS